MKLVALALLWADTRFLAALLYLLFAPQNLPFARRTIFLRGVALVLAWRLPPSRDRHYDPHWMQGYIEKLEAEIALETMVRNRLRQNGDVVLRDHARVYFLLKSVNKQAAKALLDELVSGLKPLAEASGPLERLVIRVQHTSLPDDGTLLEELAQRLTR